jgi:tetratricopeptide (TPR) repeat protein
MLQSRFAISAVFVLASILLLSPGRAAAFDGPPEARADQLFHLGLDYSRNGDCRDAIATLKLGVAADVDKSNSNTPTAYFIMGNCEVNLGDFQAAAEDYGDAIAVKPDYLLAYANRARVRDGLGDDTGALKDIDEAFSLSKGPRKPDATLYSTRGMIRFSLKQTQAALTDLDTSIALAPADAEALVDRAVVEENTGALDPALADASKAITLDNHGAKAFEVRGVVETKRGAYLAAVTDLTSAIALGDATGSVYAERGIAFLNTESYSKARADLDRAVSMGHAQPSFYFDRALVKFDLSDYRSALSDADRALSSGDKDPQAYSLRGSIRSELGDQRGAIADFTAAVQEDDQNGDRFYDRASSYYRLHDDSASIADLDRAIRLKTTKPAYRLRGIVEDRKGDLRAALADFSQAIVRDPGDAEAFMRRGITKAKLHDSAGAIADERSAEKLAKTAGAKTVLDEARAQLKFLGASP